MARRTLLLSLFLEEESDDGHVDEYVDHTHEGFIKTPCENKWIK